MPKIPQETQINAIISNASKKLSTALSISKDTGMRPIEVMSLKLRDIDLHNGTAYPSTAKHGSGRALKLKPTTVNMINQYLTNHIDINANDHIFGSWTSQTYGKWFRHVRNRVANKMQDPSMKTIRLYDLRHYFATMLYHKTRDLLFTKQQLGHRKVETTLIYTQLLNQNDDEWTCKATTNSTEATQLIENGFEYIATTPDQLMLVRKRK